MKNRSPARRSPGTSMSKADAFTDGTQGSRLAAPTNFVGSGAVNRLESSRLVAVGLTLAETAPALATAVDHPIRLASVFGAATDTLFLILYGAGFRHRLHPCCTPARTRP